MRDASLSADVFEKWLPFAEAYRQIKAHWPAHVARTELLTQLKHGLFHAVAEVTVTKLHGNPGGVMFPVPTAAWNDEPPDYDPVWKTGTLTVQLKGHYDWHEWSFIRIRIDPDDLARMLPALAGEAIPSVTPVAEEPMAFVDKGGPRRKGWWEDLIVEIVRQVQSREISGDTFASAAKLEIHLIVTCEKLGGKPGDSSIKPLSLKMFKYLQENGG